MGKEWPTYPNEVSDGDEPSHSPNKSQNSLLATERGNDFTRRIETDDSNNLFVNIAASSVGVPTTVSALAGGSTANVPANTLTTILTHTPVADVKITRISVSGQNYGKIQIFVNSSLVETKRMGPDRNVDFSWSSPLAVAASVPIDVKVTHYITGELNDFEATIYGA